MDAERLGIFEALARRMNWLGRRQETLAQNIAHADTPDYVPQDLKEDASARPFSRHLADIRLAHTDPGHLDLPKGRRWPDFATRDQRERYETAPSGNAVVLEEQLVKVAETQMDYATMTNLYRKHVQLFHVALGRGGQA